MKDRLLALLYLTWLSLLIALYTADVYLNLYRGDNFEMLRSLTLAYLMVAWLASDYDKIKRGLFGRVSCER